MNTNTTQSRRRIRRQLARKRAQLEVLQQQGRASLDQICTITREIDALETQYAEPLTEDESKAQTVFTTVIIVAPICIATSPFPHPDRRYRTRDWWFWVGEDLLANAYEGATVELRLHYCTRPGRRRRSWKVEVVRVGDPKHCEMHGTNINSDAV
jgi:hypothetical protein